MSFDYSNLNERGSARTIRLLSRVVPGIASVQRQIEPYAAWWGRSNADALASGRDLWVVLGDSMSQGIGASTPDRGWVGQLLSDPPPQIAELAALNLSFSGARVDDVAGRQMEALDRVQDLGHRVGLVTLLIGNNDLINPKWRRRLNAAMRDLLERVPVGTIVATQPGVQKAVLSFNAVVDDVARRRSLVVADFRVPHMRDWRGRLSEDHFHPNDRGYAGMAGLVRQTLHSSYAT